MYRRGRERGCSSPSIRLTPCLERVSHVGHVCRHVCAASCWHWSSYHVQQVCTHMHALHPAGMRRALPSPGLHGARAVLLVGRAAPRAAHLIPLHSRGCCSAPTSQLDAHRVIAAHMEAAQGLRSTAPLGQGCKLGRSTAHSTHRSCTPPGMWDTGEGMALTGHLGGWVEDHEGIRQPGLDGVLRSADLQDGHRDLHRVRVRWRRPH